MSLDRTVGSSFAFRLRLLVILELELDKKQRKTFLEGLDEGTNGERCCLGRQDNRDRVSK